MFSSRLREEATYNAEESIDDADGSEFPTFMLNNPGEGEFEDPLVAYEQEQEDVYKARAFQDIIRKYEAVPLSVVNYLNADGSLEAFLPLTYSYAGRENLDTAEIESITHEISTVVGSKADSVEFAKEGLNTLFSAVSKYKSHLSKIAIASGVGYALVNHVEKNNTFLPKKDLMDLIEALSNLKNAIVAIGNARSDESVTKDVEKALDEIRPFNLRIEKDKHKIIEDELAKARISRPAI